MRAGERPRAVAREMDWPSIVRDVQLGGRARDVASWKIAADALRHLGTLVPGEPPQPSQKVRELVGAVGRGDAAWIASAMAVEANARELGAYRVELSSWEAAVSRRLERLAWYHAECLRIARERPEATAEADAVARKIERVALDHWGLEALTTARGWALRMVRRYDLLPVALREWIGGGVEWQG